MARKAGPLAIMVSCEHATNHVPQEWLHLFSDDLSNDSGMLETHRGWDPGALQLAKQAAKFFGVPLHQGEVTRLLVDLNRSPHNHRRFSSFMRNLTPMQKLELDLSYHLPYWMEVCDELDSHLELKGRRVLHMSFHSFTPVLNGEERRCELGLLFDPSRPWEATVAHRWQELLAAALPQLRVRRNQPYRGRADGVTCAMRKRASARLYAGIELEVNQALLADAKTWKRTQRAVLATLEELVAELRA